MRVTVPAIALLGIAACAGSSPPISTAVRTSSGDVSLAARAIVDAPDRTDEDRGFDSERHPAELLDFLGIVPGMRVGELLAGAGYTGRESCSPRRRRPRGDSARQRRTERSSPGSCRG